MFAPTTEIIDANHQRVAIVHVACGRIVLGVKDRKAKTSPVVEVRSEVDPISITLVTALGRRLVVAGRQRVLVLNTHKKAVWRPAHLIRVRDVLLAFTDGILSADRVTAVVSQEKRNEPWITLRTESGNICAEELLCLTS